MSKPSVRGASMAGAFLLVLGVYAWAQEAAAPAPKSNDPSALPAEMMERKVKDSLLLDAVQSASGFFVVGERGHILSSGDGTKWEQRAVPTRSTFTAITAAPDGHLFAAGHDGVIVHSTDGGQTWTAQRRDPYLLVEGQDPADRDLRQGAPILDLLFLDATHGFAVGAYSLMLQTADGGATWTPIEALPAGVDTGPEPEIVASESGVFDAADLELGEEDNPHFNAIVRTGSGALVVVGERGTFLRSRDSGVTWEKVDFPYAGSLFGVLGWEDDHILAYGLRGNVYESTDLGSTWTKVDSGIATNLLGGIALDGGGAVLVGSNGVVLSRLDGNTPFAQDTFRNAAGETPALAGVLPAGSTGYVLVGEKGVAIYQAK
jgi:photosystem II stability/assembly factor-like uncharacterized protein